MNLHGILIRGFSAVWDWRNTAQTSSSPAAVVAGVVRVRVECGTALGHLAVSDVAVRPYRFRRYGRTARLQESGGGLAEPAGEVVVQVPLIVADPGDVAVGAEQDARNIQYRGGIREVIDPV